MTGINEEPRTGLDIRNCTQSELDWFHELDDHLSKFRDIFGFVPSGDICSWINGDRHKINIAPY